MKKMIISITAVWLGLCLAASAEMISNLSANAVAYYSFDNSGDLGHDDSGNGNNLSSYVTTPGYAAVGRVGGASSFDGTQGWQAGDIFTTASFTLAAFVQFDSDCPSEVKIISSGYKQNVLFSRLSNYLVYDATYDEAQNTSAATSTTTLENGGGWYHLAMSFEATSGPDASGVYTGTIKVYVNGVLEKTVTNAEYYPIPTSAMRVGRGSTQPLTGLMDEVYVFDGVLTDGDVVQLAAAYNPGTEPEPEPVPLLAYYSFDNESDLGHDDSGNGNDLAEYSALPTYTSEGRVNGASSFDGTQGWKVSTFSSPSFTLSAFVSFSTGCPTEVKMFSSGYKQNFLFCRLSNLYTYDATYDEVQNTSAAASTTTLENDAGWYHVAMSFEATSGPDANGVYTGTIKAYVNGVLEKTAANAEYAPISSYIFIGRGSTQPLTGLMDEIYVYGGALTDNEVADLARQGAPTGYPGWAQNWGVDIGVATNDYDGDGLINLYEYALGGNPTNALDTGTSPQYGLVEQGGTTYFGYVYPQLTNTDSGLNYSLETCTNLVSGTWTNADYTVLGTNLVGSMNMVSNYTDTVDSQKFIRLMISTNTP